MARAQGAWKASLYSNSRCSRRRISSPGITLIPTLRRIIAGWFQTLKEPFGTNRVYLLLKQGASPKRKIDTAAQVDGVPGAIVVKSRASRPWGVAMLQSNRVPETQRLRSTEEVCLNHFAGVRTFIEGCGRIESISEEMRELVASRWPDLVRKLPRKN